MKTITAILVVLIFLTIGLFQSIVFLPTLPAQETREVSFSRDIRPLLSDRCFACHGPDASTRQAGLRLDTAEGSDGAYSSAIDPGSAEDSELWLRISSDDEDEIMPPPDSHFEPLDEEQQEMIRQWIESGANYETFWAFEPPTWPSIPDIASDWSEQPIDLLILKQHESAGLVHAEEADDRALIRRVSFDLTGLPPTRQEIANFLAARQQSPDAAWEQLVDQLLEREQYGEHMARYWLDVVRFADTNGMHKDFYRNNVVYRDWVIRSFNDNLHYDDFVRYQLAGDLYEQPTDDQLIASGFHRLHLIIDRGTALPEESFSKNVIDRVTAVGTGFLGLTVHCAQCHDHKYDPITQEDFYSLSAFFNNIDAEPETGNTPKRGLQDPFLSFATPEQEAKLTAIDDRIDELETLIESVDGRLEQEEGTQSTQSLILEQEQLYEQLRLAKQEREQVDNQIVRAMVMKEREEVRPTFILKRGEYDAPGKPVERDTPGFLPPLEKRGDVATRMDFADWVVSQGNPLTARVAANRIWQQFFGVGPWHTFPDGCRNDS